MDILLQHFEIGTLVNIELVKLGARPAFLIEHSYVYLPNPEEYELANTKYPEEFKAFYEYRDEINRIAEEVGIENADWEEYDVEGEKFYSLYGAEEKRLLLKRVKSSLRKFRTYGFDTLHCVSTSQGVLVTREPLKTSVISHLQNIDDGLIGEILGYPCRKNFMKMGPYNKSYTIDFKLFEDDESYQIFANTFCQNKDKEKFDKLAKKYEKVLNSKRSIFHGMIEKVYVR